MPEKVKMRHAQYQLKQRWEDKPMHGQYPKRVHKKDVDHQMGNQWLKTAELKSETEGFLSLLPETRPSRPTTIAARS